MTPGPSLAELIASIRADAPGADSLTQLTEAVTTVTALEEVADATLAHFVDQCRREGRSWSEISKALGVTKQAAHKRFSFTPRLERFTPRARRCSATPPVKRSGSGTTSWAPSTCCSGCSSTTNAWRRES